MNYIKNQTLNGPLGPGRQNPRSRLWLLLWLWLFALFVAWRAQNLDAFGLSNDEGAHLMWARLAVDGYPLYSQTQAVQAPFFLEWVGLAFRLAGQTIQAGRWAMLIGFGLLAAALSWLAYRGGGWPGAVMAMLLLGLAPLTFSLSRLVMAEVPATGLAVLSVAVLFLFLDTGRRLWLLVSGVALGLSFITKALNPFVAAPIGLLLLARSRAAGRYWPDVLWDGFWWGVGVLGPLVLPWLIYDPMAMYDQLIAFRGDLRAAIPGSWPETWTHFTTFLTSHWGFWLLAGGGIISGAWRMRAHGKCSLPAGRSTPSSLPLPVVWLVWLVAGMVMLAWHTPLFPHHFVVLLPPLILLGAGFISDIVALWRVEAAAPGQLPGSGRVGTAVLSIIIVAAAFNIPAVIEANQQTAAIVTGGRERQALALLQAVSGPDDFVMGDSQLLIFMAGRRTPPPLGDVALVAIKAGRQTSARMIELSQTYQAPAVVQWSLRLPWLPEYLAWVEAHYLARRVWDNDHLIYFAPRFPASRAIPHERTARLGDALSLRGYQLDAESGRAGQPLSLKVYWQTSRALAQDYTVFTQLLDDQGNLVAGWDSQPLGGYFPTGQWPAGEIITDIVQLPLPADLPAGEYKLVTGMYLLETGERLPTLAGDDKITLTTLAVDE